LAVAGDCAQKCEARDDNLNLRTLDLRSGCADCREPVNV
jgi:hypothetical protein